MDKLEKKVDNRMTSYGYQPSFPTYPSVFLLEFSNEHAAAYSTYQLLFADTYTNESKGLKCRTK